MDPAPATYSGSSGIRLPHFLTKLSAMDSDKLGALAVLLWASPHPEADTLLIRTRVSTGPTAPTAPPTEPLVFQIAKRTVSANSFGMGITVGRAPQNDIYIGDDSVSRFHAFFMRDDTSGRWSLRDGGSRNGTLVNDKELSADKSVILDPRASVCFGDIRLSFFHGDEFLRFASGMSAAKP